MNTKSIKYILPILFSVMFIGITYQCVPSKRKILIMDSGVKLSPEIQSVMCDSGHENFIPDGRSNPFENETSHGTMIAAVISEQIDPNEYCIVVYRTFAKVGGTVATLAYREGLIEAKKHKYDSIVIALEDEGYYLDEIELFKELAKHSRIFVAAGNSRKNLDQKCDVYPACLAFQVKSDNFRVVGDLKNEFNSGSLINEREYSEYSFNNFDYHGTSVSTARAAGKYSSQTRNNKESVTGVNRKISSK